MKRRNAQENRDVLKSESATASAPVAPLEPAVPLAHGYTADRKLGIRWPLVLGLAAASAALVWVLLAIQPTRFRASAVAAVAPIAGQLSPTDVIRGVESLDGRVVVATLAALATTPANTREVNGGEYSIQASVLPNTSLFRITVEGDDPARAAEIANRLPLLLARQAESIYTVFTVRVVSAAEPGRSVEPRTARAVVAGLLFGAALGIALSWLLNAPRT